MFQGMFEPFLKSFFVRTSDATHIKLLKLEILTTLATETSISVILREFQTYISSNDKEFVTATIQAIGRYILMVFIHIKFLIIIVIKSNPILNHIFPDVPQT